MKNLFSLIIATFFVTNLFAQVEAPNRIFKKDQADLYVTVGLLPTFLADGAKQRVLPFNVGADFMVGDHFSIGGAFGYSESETGNTRFIGGENGNLRNKYMEATLKMGLHITRNDNMSIYGGFSLSYHHSNINATEGNMEKISFHTGIKSNQHKVLPGGYVGFKYAFSNKLTAMSEVGYGVSLVRLGVGYRLK